MEAEQRWLAAALVALAAMGCSSLDRPPPTSPADLDEPAAARVAAADWRRYFEAVEDARVPERYEISKELWPLFPGAGKLAWKDGRVLMVTWTRAIHFSDPAYRTGHLFPLYDDTWLTAVPAVRDFCTGYSGSDLAARLRQLIGLPPDNRHDAFLEIWVRPQDLFRPCPDPEITDAECQVEIPLLDAPPPEPGGPPWYCPPPGDAPAQQQGRFVVVRQSHLAWMCGNWRASFTNEEPRKNYPWTALGYTYDWGNPGDPKGPSEFVAVADSPVVFERLVPTDAYCGR